MLTLISHTGTIIEESVDKHGALLQNSYAKWLAKCECGVELEVNCHTIQKYNQHCGSQHCKMILINRNRKAKIEKETRTRTRTR